MATFVFFKHTQYIVAIFIIDNIERLDFILYFNASITHIHKQVHKDSFHNDSSCLDSESSTQKYAEKHRTFV